MASWLDLGRGPWGGLNSPISSVGKERLVIVSPGAARLVCVHVFVYVHLFGLCDCVGLGQMEGAWPGKGTN